MQSKHYLPRAVPSALQGLATLAIDLHWSWHHGTDELWQTVDPDLWEATANPWLIIESVSDQRMQELANDPSFLKALEQQLAAREEHFDAETWFSSEYDGKFSDQIAYFSMEFGLSEALPIYSGGLGVLAGDYLKTACDLDVPLIGVGLLYQQGYFRQVLDANGEQIEFYPYNDPTMLPVVPLRDDNGAWVHVTIDLPGRPLRLRTWYGQVGRRTLLLLDSNDPLNEPGDRGITSELYGGGSEMRLQQEIVLGVGGWRLLEELGMHSNVCHLNEGHAAFALLERARYFMQVSGQSFQLALRATRAGNLFTTHTPVEAGIDQFSPDLFSLYFYEYAVELGVEVKELLALGRVDASQQDAPFNMAYLAIRGSGAVNGVSQLHSAVSRRIFQPLFPRWSQEQVPVGHVTNAVHVPSWDSIAADTLWTQACGKARWRGDLKTNEDELRKLPDEALWALRTQCRQQMISFIRQRLKRQYRGRGAARQWIQECCEILDPDVLTLGFARRFAEYKRTNLLLHDPERFIKLLTNRDRPVQLVIAGKAHPQDAKGKQMLHAWLQFIALPEVRGRVVFVEDYDLVVAEQLTQGVDVWINTPRRPWEASGTSGMKVLVNGGLNLSELDGWWAEAYTPEVGWALGDRQEHADTQSWDAAEAEQLYRLLEQEVVPCFYQRNDKGLPHGWIDRMRESMASLTTQYSTNRMLREYMQSYYVPLADAYRRRIADDNALAVDLEQWYTHLAQHWHRIHFGEVMSQQANGQHHFMVPVYLDELRPETIQVQLYADATEQNESVCQPLERGELLSGTNNAYVFLGSVAENRPASDYTPRIVPRHPEASVPLEANFILWYR
jgi:starch phosphorylase